MSSNIKIEIKEKFDEDMENKLKQRLQYCIFNSLKKSNDIYYKKIIKNKDFFFSLNEITNHIKSSGFDMNDLFKDKNDYKKTDIFEKINEIEDFLLISKDLNVENNLKDLKKAIIKPLIFNFKI